MVVSDNDEEDTDGN